MLVVGGRPEGGDRRWTTSGWKGRRKAQVKVLKRRLKMNGCKSLWDTCVLRWQLDKYLDWAGLEKNQPFRHHPSVGDKSVKCFAPRTTV